MELHIWIPAFAASALLLLPYCNLVVKVNAELREEREHPEMNPSRSRKAQETQPTKLRCTPCMSAYLRKTLAYRPAAATLHPQL